jgi:spermidine synthase
MSQWFYEEQERGVRLGLEYEEHLHSSQSPFQRVDVYRTKALGNLLTLDGLVMTTERDEFVYHEMLSHPALFTHPDPEQVLVIGGGDGGTLREVVKHARVKQGHLCEIDGRVCEVSKEFLPELAGSLEHPKSTVYIQDGFDFLDRHQKEYQVILIDSTDPIGEAAKLFEDTFIHKVEGSLTEDGIAVMQCENPFFQMDVMKSMYGIFRKIFPVVRFYLAPIPTYPSGFWAFLMGSKEYDPMTNFQTEAWNNCGFRTRFYNQEIHFASMAIPQYLKDELGDG